ncbi:MAG TPA: hypothetical protein VGP30_00135 [Candidatus Limnocylindrales bacterium]|nr:hypothetical protein [Candidatus Limnocylindrales bacterium]
MGEEPLAETRLAISAQRGELERTADQLREALDVKKRFQENPALVLGLGASAIFLIVGGPVRAARFARRRLFRSDPEKAYDALPKPMQSWVDSMAGTIGPRATEARQSLSEELLRWRHDPKRNSKISKKMAEEIAKGPAGPKRSAWTAFEAGAAILTAALARKAVERFLSGEPPSGIAPLDAIGTAGGAAEPDPRHAKNDVTRKPEERAGAADAEKRDQYAGMSSRDR